MSSKQNFPTDVSPGELTQMLVEVEGALVRLLDRDCADPDLLVDIICDVQSFKMVCDGSLVDSMVDREAQLDAAC